MLRLAFRNLATAEAAKVILTHEKIPFEIGEGPGLRVIDIDEMYRGNVKYAIGEWTTAISNLRYMLLAEDT